MLFFVCVCDVIFLLSVMDGVLGFLLFLFDCGFG